MNTTFIITLVTYWVIQVTREMECNMEHHRIIISFYTTPENLTHGYSNFRLSSTRVAPQPPA
jgi:hypothetical protein